MALSVGWLSKHGLARAARQSGLSLALILAAAGTADAQPRAAEPRTGGTLIQSLVVANVRDVGEGPAIVLIHGLSAAMDWWDPIIPTLAATHRVIAVDLIGHGGTEAPEAGYEIERHAALVSDLMAQLGVAEATIVGHSLGGQVATALAETYPGLVARLVIMNTPAADVGFDLGERILEMPVVGQLLAELVTDEMVRRLLEPMFAPGVPVPDALVADARQLTFTALQQTQAAGEAYRTAMPIHVRIGRLVEPPPTLVILSELDQIVPLTDTALYATVPAIRVRVLPGIGHSPMIEAPAETAALIAAFIAEPPVLAVDAPVPPAQLALPPAPGL